MGIVGVSQKTGYKVAKWVLLGLGCLFFLFGGFFMLSSLGSSNTKPQAIHFTAAGIVLNEEEGYYSLDVYKKETTLIVNTTPFGSASRVNFTIEEGEDCLTITPKIWPGAEATLTLKGDSKTAYQFGRTVKILVKSGQTQEFLHVNIVLPPDQVSFNFEIQDENSGWAIPNNVISAQAYLSNVYDNNPNAVSPSRYWSSYKLNTKFMVWDVEVENVAINCVPQGDDFGIKPFGVPTGSNESYSLFGNPYGFRNIYIPIGVLASIGDGPKQSTSISVRFMITAEYLGNHIDFFELKIVK